MHCKFRLEIYMPDNVITCSRRSCYGLAIRKAIVLDGYRKPITEPRVCACYSQLMVEVGT
jgi:hypothetical protein